MVEDDQEDDTEEEEIEDFQVDDLEEDTKVVVQGVDRQEEDDTGEAEQVDQKDLHKVGENQEEGIVMVGKNRNSQSYKKSLYLRLRIFLSLFFL